MLIRRLCTQDKNSGEEVAALQEALSVAADRVKAAETRTAELQAKFDEARGTSRPLRSL